MSNFERIKPALVKLKLPKNGHASSADLNNFIDQTIHDIASLVHTVNDLVLPIFDGLGVPGTYQDLDPTTGLDGKTLFLNNDWTDVSSPYYWNTSKNRPSTVNEAFKVILSDINKLYLDINLVNARLGTAPVTIDGSKSSATLAEIETKVNQHTAVLYGLQTTNASYVTTQALNTTLGNWQISASGVQTNAGIAAANISGVLLTDSFVYTGGYPANYDMKDTVLRLKTWIQDLTGETFSSFNGTNVTSGLPTYKAHVQSLGPGAVTTSNPHGMDIKDLSDSTGLLSKPQIIASFDLPTGASQDITYFYVPTSWKVSSWAITLATSGNGFTAQLWKRSSGSNYLIASGLTVAPNPTPGYNSAALTGQTVSQNDLLFISGVSGTGTNAKIIVFGTN